MREQMGRQTESEANRERYTQRIKSKNKKTDRRGWRNKYRDLRKLCSLDPIPPHHLASLPLSFFSSSPKQTKPTCKTQGQLLPESKVMTWFVQTALGLHYMHTNRVLHRDIKTQNVFILSSGRVVLGDLGISKARNIDLNQ